MSEFDGDVVVVDCGDGCVVVVVVVIVDCDENEIFVVIVARVRVVVVVVVALDIHIDTKVVVVDDVGQDLRRMLLYPLLLVALARVAIPKIQPRHMKLLFGRY